MPGVCLCHKEIDRFPSSSTAPKSEILGCSEERITRLHKNPDTLGPLAKEMTFNQIRNYLSSIRVVYDSNGNCRWLEITKRQQQIAVRLGLPGVYDAVPTWAMK